MFWVVCLRFSAKDLGNEDQAGSSLEFVQAFL